MFQFTVCTSWFARPWNTNLLRASLRMLFLHRDFKCAKPVQKYENIYFVMPLQPRNLRALCSFSQLTSLNLHFVIVSQSIILWCRQPQTCTYTCESVSELIQSFHLRFLSLYNLPSQQENTCTFFCFRTWFRNSTHIHIGEQLQAPSTLN